MGGHKKEQASGPPPNHLRQWRVRAGLSQSRVEKALGWHHSRLSHLENNSARITDKVLQALAPLYGCQPADMLRSVSREEMREVMGFQPPQQKKLLAAVTDPIDVIAATLTHLMVKLVGVRADLRTVREESAARLDAQDKQIALLIRETAKAIKNTSQTTARIGRRLTILNETINQVAADHPEAANDEPIAE